MALFYFQWKLRHPPPPTVELIALSYRLFIPLRHPSPPPPLHLELIALSSRFIIPLLSKSKMAATVLVS